MGVSVNIDLSNLKRITNNAYYPLYGVKNRNLLLVGGAGSGKSADTAQRIAIRLMREFGHHFVAFRKVARTIKTSTWAEFGKALNRLGVERLWKPNLTERTYTFLPNGNVFRCIGLDDPEKIKSIVGMTGAWMEEATEFLPEDYEQVNLRLRGVTPFYKQIILTFNPISVSHWIKEHFFDTPQEGRTYILHTTYRDNRFLDPDYVRELEALRLRNYSLWQVYAEGIWGLLKGIIYDREWPYATLDCEPDETIYGIDFGYNNPMALVRIDLKDKKAFLTEKCYESEWTTRDLIRFMKEECDIPAWVPVYADAAEPDRIREIADAGFNVFPALKGPGSVRAGIDFVKAFDIYTNENNVNINKEKISYKWAEDKNGRTLDEPVKLYDHAMDAIRYGLFSHFAGMVNNIKVG